MDDAQIIELYLSRRETAVEETSIRFGRLIRSTAMNMLGSEEDALECENDTYMALWNSIPPNKPENLTGYICRIAKNLALTRFRDSRRQKRSAQVVALDELAETLPGRCLEDEVTSRELGRAIDKFLSETAQRERVIFIGRYWYGYSVGEIAKNLHLTANAVSLSLHKTRNALCKYLTREGLYNE